MKLPLLPLTLLPPLLTAALLTLHIPTTPLANPSTLPPTTHATLQSAGPPLTAHLTRSNSFLFIDVPPGSYLATIHCRDYIFEPLRIDITLEEAGEGRDEKKEVIRAWQTFFGNEWENKGESRGSGSNGAVVVEVRPVARKEYYEQRGGFSPLSFLKNPMILMALVSGVLIFGMPYLMENMDPETKAEFEEMQKKSPLTSGANPAEALQNFDLASWMAGKKDSGSAAASDKKRGNSPNPQGKRRG
ncbi:uncharacterized protein EI97DRAFT_259900 [Westerdykella ornata]|uniref:ER membrane protein complex subunit 7 beta-sandwich domain-containing protein n=1 Tax=Westerdykella ornata TaxID=318751 RepID=A0A6A6J7V2_WESOR|nr:uncharacterized protein EI97DRAFT_259900 [Westerdykella ornata]KAF2271706.1 hypothetical protein EI97DRAFT_259900 [Westerdykella ornata]